MAVILRLPPKTATHASQTPVRNGSGVFRKAVCSTCVSLRVDDLELRVCSSVLLHVAIIPDSAHEIRLHGCTLARHIRTAAYYVLRMSLPSLHLHGGGLLGKVEFLGWSALRRSVRATIPYPVPEKTAWVDNLKPCRQGLKNRGTNVTSKLGIREVWLQTLFCQQSQTCRSFIAFLL